MQTIAMFIVGLLIICIGIISVIKAKGNGKTYEIEGDAIRRLDLNNKSK